MLDAMSQVIIVSNRLPINVTKQGGKLRFVPSLGGIATGLSSYVNDKQSTWIGWPGIASDDLTNQEKEQIINKLAEYNYQPVFLSQKQVDDFYTGYSNTVLWPLFHSLSKERVEPKKRRAWWQTYRKVNKLYADAVLGLSTDDSRIWIHDYQLLLVPEMIRAQRLDITPGFFLHIPFPPVKIFTKLPEHKKLLKGLLGADLIGFHTPGYVNDFLANCEAVGYQVSGSERVQTEERIVKVSHFPMGIDYQKYATAAKSRAVKAAMRRYKRRYKGLKVIAAVDRLDPSKGLVERLEAYQKFLAIEPAMHGKVVFSMVAAPSRTSVPAYRRLTKQLAALVKTINKKYGTATWQPVDYINRAVPFEEVAALFRVADVAFIAPLRDGMNLAAKEFVASSRKNGVLILSQTAGAAEELQDALIVNPKQPDSVVEALQQALGMRKRELRRRLKSMKQQLSSHTVQDWAKDFVQSLQQPVPGARPRTHTLNRHLKAQLIREYQGARKRLLLLDYDGSLVPFSKDFKQATPPKSVVQLLERLASDRLNDVVLISGRSSTDLSEWFGHLPISLVAEHGAAMRRAGNKNWQTIERSDNDWKRLLLPILEKYAARTPGARVEVKSHSLVWHYRAAQAYYAQKSTVNIKRGLKPIIKKYGLEVMQGNKVIEIKNPMVSKGMAAQRWLAHGYDFVLAIGDDRTDEELFAIVPDGTWSVKVGRRRTLARFRVGSYKDIVALLRRFSKTLH